VLSEISADPVRGCDRRSWLACSETEGWKWFTNGICNMSIALIVGGIRAYEFPETRRVGVGVLRFTLFAVVSPLIRLESSGLGAASGRLAIFRRIDKVLVSLVLGLDEHSL
jgi:hypothetical protein